MESWYDYEQQKAITFPPEKTRCQFEIGASWQDGLLIASHGDTGWFASDLGGYMMLDAERFRPLDYATRAKELERGRVVQAARSAWRESGCGKEGVFEFLYDIGALKLP